MKETNNTKQNIHTQILRSLVSNLTSSFALHQWSWNQLYLLTDTSVNLDDTTMWHQPPIWSWSTPSKTCCKRSRMRPWKPRDATLLAWISWLLLPLRYGLTMSFNDGCNVFNLIDTWVWILEAVTVIIHSVHSDYLDLCGKLIEMFASF